MPWPHRQTQFARIVRATIVGLAVAVPVCWLIFKTILHLDSVRNQFDAQLFESTLRTFLHSASVATLACAVGVPAGLSLGFSRRRQALAVVMLALPLLVPTLVHSYAWREALMLVRLDPRPQSFADELRCVITLTAWSFPVPAGVIGLYLKRVDTSPLLQATLDGVFTRAAVRSAVPAIAAAWAAVFLLASQEFSVFEATGLRVLSTELRISWEDFTKSADERFAATMLRSMPMVLMSLLAAGAAWIIARRLPADDADDIPLPTAVRLPRAVRVLSFVLPAVLTLVPIVGLVGSYRSKPNIERMFVEFGANLIASTTLSIVTAVIAVSMGIVSLISWPRGSTVLAILGFLIGGQTLAIGLIEIFSSNSLLRWAYDTPGTATLAFLGRFLWIPLLVAAWTWRGGWRELRDMAALDGATPTQTARRVVLPMIRPALLAAGLLVALLVFVEVPATILLQPTGWPIPVIAWPPAGAFTSLLMGWVHIQRYEPMIEASLLIVSLAVVLGVSVVVLFRRRTLGVPVLLVLLIFIGGCGGGDRAEEVWFDVQRGSGRLVYPRAITYSEQLDQFFVVDRTAEIVVLDSNGKELRSWKTPEHVTGKPVGMTIGPDGNLYVADTHYFRVLVYSPEGELLKKIGSRGHGPGEFELPCDIAFDSQGRMFVSEYGGNDRVQVFDSSGAFLYAFGEPGRETAQFARPQSLVIVDDEVYIADACNHVIQVWSIDGRFKRNLGGVGSGPGQFRFPYGLELDREKNLIVTEFGQSRVQRISRDGRPLAIWGRPGHAEGELMYPWAAVVDQRGRVVVVDAGNNRLQVFRW